MLTFRHILFCAGIASLSLFLTPESMAQSAAAGRAAPKSAQAAPANLMENTAAGKALLAVWSAEGHLWTTKVSAAWLAFVKAEALKEVADAKQSLPADFLAFVDATPVVALTIYGHGVGNAANRLRLLRSLELDVGKDAVRGKYRELALAFAVVHAAAEGPKANLAEREPMTLKIPGDPRVIVNTHPKDRPLDVNDHIINFLNDHAPIPDDGHGQRIVWPELAYDEDGETIRNSDLKPQVVPGKAPVKTRRLFAADVIESPELEKEFNDYMKAHGQTVQINCGSSTGKRLTWGSHDVVGVNQAGVRAAFDLFLKAYKAKGYFPADRDPIPTPAEGLAFYKMIGDYVPPAGARPAGPMFPITAAPWPVMTFLAMDKQSLRERGDAWERYRTTGEFHGYGEYVGPIAQNPPMLIARRLTPFEFNYGSLQTMCKDGGVCGTMAGISVANHQSLGAPASTAHQPQHCAVIKFMAGADGTFVCRGGQYATAGDLGTTSHKPSVFGGGSHRNMYAHQGIAYAVNAGAKSFLETLAARHFVAALPDNDRKEHGIDTLVSALPLNPYSLPLIESAQAQAATAGQMLRVAQAHAAGLKAVADKPGCPQTCLMLTIVRQEFYDRLAKLPVPADKTEATAVRAFFVADKCTVQKLLTNYQLALDGADGEKRLLDTLEADFKAHLAGKRNRDACKVMAERIQALTDSVCDPAKKQGLLASFKEQIRGHEDYSYLQPRPKLHRITVEVATDPCAALLLGKSASNKDEFVAAFQRAMSGPRDESSCKLLAHRLNAVAKDIKAPKDRIAFGNELIAIIAGHEAYAPGVLDHSVPVIYSLGVDMKPVTKRLLADYKAAMEGGRTTTRVAELSQRLKLVIDRTSVPERPNLGKELMALIASHEVYASDAKRPEIMSLDPSVALVYSLIPDLTPVKTQLVEDFKTAIAGRRTVNSAAILEQRLQTLLRYLPTAPARKELGESLLAILDGKEIFAPDPAKPSELVLDPALAPVYSLGVNLAPAKAKFSDDLKAAVSGKRTPESTKLLAQRLGFIVRGITNPVERKDWAESLLAIVADKESYSATTRDKKGVREVQLEDPCAVQIYRLLGRKTPAQMTQVK